VGSSSPAAGVRQTIREFGNDLLSGDYGAACALFTPSARTSVGGANCSKLLSAAMSRVGSGQKAQLQSQVAKVDNWPVSVHGNTATAPNANGGSTSFVKQGGRWLISSSVSR
jgi:hypothetical protein